MVASEPTATARSASPWRNASAASITDKVPPALWLVMQALLPLRLYLMPTWQSTLLGSVRRSHIGLTALPSSRPKVSRSPCDSLIRGKYSYCELYAPPPEP